MYGLVVQDIAADALGQFYDWILTSGGEIRESLYYTFGLSTLAYIISNTELALSAFHFPQSFSTFRLGSFSTFRLRFPSHNPHPQSSVTQGNVLTCLRLITIVFSERADSRDADVGHLERSRVVLAVLVGTFVACAAPGIAIIERDIATTVLGPSADPDLADVQQCQVFTSAAKHVWVAPYLVVMVFEAVVLALTLYRVLSYYREVPEETRTPLLDVLWIDGVMYFVFMLLLGVMNVVLVLQESDPQLRTGGTQLQMVLHGILSTRIVLHIAHTTHQDLVDSRCTLGRYRVENTMEFANVSEVTAEAVVLDDEPTGDSRGVELARRGKDPARAV
ncbi:hypothetical protein BC834DRAFT_841496 [Gloeopeniophorella convolvens]|nr:hypothetical protein BC834DRAFT_841496 [Gloeopeniophorella convolvens]